MMERAYSSKVLPKTVKFHSVSNPQTDSTFRVDLHENTKSTVKKINTNILLNKAIP